MSHAAVTLRQHYRKADRIMLGALSEFLPG